MLRFASVAVSIAIAVATAPAFGQTADATKGASAVAATETLSAAAETGAAPASAEVSPPGQPEAALLTGDEIDALTSRIALYPDPLLELTLQATIFPLQAVQAVRFLEKHAEDPSLQPDPEWDESIFGLLNYPVVLQAMNDDLDWTEALGNAVLNQLEDVQDSIQQFRSQLYAGGVLKSDEKQRIIVSNDVIAILPADAEVIFVPQYDPAAFAPPAETEAEMAALAPAEGSEAEPTAEPAAEPTAEPAEEPVADAVEYQTAAAGTEAAPVYAAQPVYAAAPPVAYSDPYPSFWSTAATFVGGAAVGGLIGYAIGDDDDDDDDGDCCDFDEDDFDDFDGGGNNWSKDVNIEDSNIVINRDDDIRDNPNARPDQLPRKNTQAELRKRQVQGQGQTAASNRRDVQTAGTAPVRKARTAQPNTEAAALKKQPSAQKKAATKPVGKRPGDTAVKRADAGALSGAKQTSGKQVKAESRRGSESRAVSQNKAPTKQAQAQKKPKGGAALSKPKSNKQVQRQSNRGKSSGGGKKRRG